MRNLWRVLLAALLGVLAIQHATYGIASIVNPAQMATEYGVHGDASESELLLTRTLGVSQAIYAATAALACYWIARFGCFEGRMLGRALATVNLGLSIFWFTNSFAWDGWWYLATGALLLPLTFAPMGLPEHRDD